MGAGHRVKSVSMGKFSQEEISALEAGGNQVGSTSKIVSVKLLSSCWPNITHGVIAGVFAVTLPAES